jgi:phage-related baseplate assembly protein
VTSDGTRYFATNSIAVLQSGDDHIDLAVTAVEGGSSYNGIASDEIRTLVDLVPYVTSVSSLTETSGGDDGETYTDEGDDRYRERIRLSAARFSTAGPIRSYEYWALSADPDIETVAVITPAPGEVTLIPVMRGGTMPTQDVLDKVLAVCNADDVRPMTDFVRVSAPTPVMYDIDIHYYTTIADEAACVETIEGEGDAIGHYIAAQSAAMGLDINPDLLRKYLLAPAKGTGALRVDVAAPVFSVLDAQSLAVFSGNVSVSHEVVEP